jgi:hypothetical protein
MVIAPGSGLGPDDGARRRPEGTGMTTPTEGNRPNGSDSPHVLSATDVNRGDTPNTWNATGPLSVENRFTSIDGNSGPADFSGHATGPFENGPGRWLQT